MALKFIKSPVKKNFKNSFLKESWFIAWTKTNIIWIPFLTSPNLKNYFKKRVTVKDVSSPSMKSVIFSAEYLSNKLFPLNLSPVSWSPLYMQPHEIKSVFMFIFKNNILRNYNQDSRSNNWRSEDLNLFLIYAWVQM